MTTIKIFLLAGILFIICGVTPCVSQNPEQIYQKALMKEEGEGNLPDAIEFYSQVVDHSDANKSLQAKALLHIGMCYEKLGKQEATKAYQNLVDNFPGQKNEVAIARERLSRLSPIPEKTSNPLIKPLIPTFLKIKMSSILDNGLLSSDGKWCAFISEGSVWVIPVSGEVNPYIAGEPKKLTDNIGAWDMGGSFCWSANGKWIAFNAEVDFKSSSASIYVIPSSGGNPQKVRVPFRRCGSLEDFRLSLSPDGKMLAYTSGTNDFGEYDSHTTRIYSIPVKGGMVNELTGPGTHEPAYSPDGSKITYVKSYKNNDGKQISDVWVIPSSGGTPNQVSNLKSGQVIGPVWSADGKMIAFHRRPEGEDPKEIWIVPITNEGKPASVPRKIGLPHSAFHTVAGWTTENKIGIQLMDPMYEIIYTVPAEGGIATQVTPQGWTSYPKWTPDGNEIFFRWSSGKIASVPSSGGDVDSIPIRSEFDIYTAVPGSGNDISPDGKTIVFSGVKNFMQEGGKQWEVDIFTIAIDGGKPKQLTTSGKLQDRFPAWSPDGNYIAFIRPQLIGNEPVMQIYTISKEGENLRKLTDESHKIAWAPIDWSPEWKINILFFG